MITTTYGMPSMSPVVFFGFHELNIILSFYQSSEAGASIFQVRKLRTKDLCVVASIT